MILNPRVLPECPPTDTWVESWEIERIVAKSHKIVKF